MEFQDKHPAVEIELTLENRSVDLIHENIGLALGMGRPAERSLILRRIGSSKRVLVSSPTYLDRRGPIGDCESLSKHDLVVTNASLRRGALVLCRGDEKIVVAVRLTLTTNNAQVLVDALKAAEASAPRKSCSSRTN